MNCAKKLLNILYGKELIHSTVMYNLTERVLVSRFKPYNKFPNIMPDCDRMCVLHFSNFDDVVIGRYSFTRGDFLYGETGITLRRLDLYVDGWRYL